MNRQMISLSPLASSQSLNKKQQQDDNDGDDDGA